MSNKSAQEARYHESANDMCSSNPETTTPAFDKQTSLSHRHAN